MQSVMFLKRQLAIRACLATYTLWYIRTFNPDFELVAVVVDGFVQTAVPETKTGKLLAVIVFDNSHTQCSDGFVI